jgi:hypothetical protein
MRTVWILLVGFFAGLWWSERERNKATAQKGVVLQTPPRQSRTLEEISPTYASNPHPLKELSAISEDNLHGYATGIAQEMVKPNLSELEAKLAGDYLGKMIMDAALYYDRRQRMKNGKSEAWLNEAIEMGLEDDADER